MLSIGAMVACESGEETSADADTTIVDAGPASDAHDRLESDASPPPPRCAAGDYSDVGEIPLELSDTVVSIDSQNFVKLIAYKGVINDDVDIAAIELFDGFGVFQNGLRPGTFELDGPELQYSTCGVCVRVFADVGPLQDVRQVYMATSGTVTITDLGVSGPPNRFRAQLSNVSFEHVTIDERTFESNPVGDGCFAAISSLETDSLAHLPQ